MLRLRTTTGLSVLALAIGIAGTGWLSTLTAGWNGPPPRHVANHPSTSPRRSHSPVRVVQVHRLPPAVVSDGDAQATAAPPPALVPLETPADMSQPWYRLRGHLDGSVVLHVDTDGDGHVERASVTTSSGDPVLDAHALRSVRGWRFAVPRDQPAGVSGELSVRFSSRGDRLAHAP